MIRSERSSIEMISIKDDELRTGDVESVNEHKKIRNIEFVMQTL